MYQTQAAPAAAAGTAVQMVQLQQVGGAGSHTAQPTGAIQQVMTANGQIIQVAYISVVPSITNSSPNLKYFMFQIQPVAIPSSAIAHNGQQQTIQVQYQPVTSQTQLHFTPQQLSHAVASK